MRAARGLHGEADVLLDAEVRKQIGELEGAAEARRGCAAARSAAVMSVPSNRMLPPDGAELAGDQVEIGGLAGAVGADDGGELAGAEACS